MEIHNRAKFHLLHICGCQVIYFQSLSYQQKGAFWAAFGWFLVDYKPKSSRICTKFSPVMQYKVKYHICHGFLFSFENWKNGAKKPIFWHFFKGFPATPPEPLCATPKSFAKRKVSLTYIIVPSFIFIAFVVLKLKIFKMFRGDGPSMNWSILGFFLTLTPPNMIRSC